VTLSSAEVVARQRVPRGARAAAREEAILDAALELLQEVGYDKMTIEAVAERAHAGKATIYRHFPDKAALVVRAISRGAEVELIPADTGSLRGDLLAYGRRAANSACVDDRLFAGVWQASRTDEVLGALLNERMWESKQRAIRLIAERAVERGELTDTSRIPIVCQVVCAVVLHRVIVERAEPDETFRVHLVDDIAIPLLTYRGSPPAEAGLGEPTAGTLATPRMGSVARRKARASTGDSATAHSAYSRAARKS
jgi:AcrR family transcriptional regulator